MDHYHRTTPPTRLKSEVLAEKDRQEKASKSAPCSEVTIEFESRDVLLAALCEKTFGAKPTYQNAKADD